jgi:CcmD family protein
MILLLAQVTAEGLEAEQRFLQHNYEFLSYALIAAWLILAGYVLLMFARQKKLKREIDSLRTMLQEKR